MPDKILAGREERYLLGKNLLEAYRVPLLVATVNFPGPEKVHPTAWFVFQEMADSLRYLHLEHKVSGVNEAGPYLMGTITGDILKAKEKTAAIEDQHPLGRIFDLDLVAYPYRRVGRQDLGLARRKCLLCLNPAIQCMRGGKHPLPELLQKIEKLIGEYYHEGK
jgi:holo-ACP synthase